MDGPCPALFDAAGYSNCYGVAQLPWLQNSWLVLSIVWPKRQPPAGGEIGADPRQSVGAILLPTPSAATFARRSHQRARSDDHLALIRPRLGGKGKAGQGTRPQVKPPGGLQGRAGQVGHRRERQGGRGLSYPGPGRDTGQCRAGQAGPSHPVSGVVGKRTAT